MLKACRALLSEWRLGPKEWPCVLECVQTVLNHAPLKRLGLRNPKVPDVYRTSLEVFTGHKPVRPLMRARPIKRFWEARNDDELQLRQILDIKRLQEAMEKMHSHVTEAVSNIRARAIRWHNRCTNVHDTNFVVGDFVLVRSLSKGGHKLQLTWRGPRRINMVISDLAYEIENILSKKCETVHAWRLQLYRADMDGREVERELINAIEHSEAHYETAHAIRDIRSKPETDTLEVQVECGGLPDALDYTWEEADHIF